MENTPMETTVRLESRAPSLLERDLAEYCRLRAGVHAFVADRPRLATFLATLAGGGDWEAAAREIEQSLVAVPVAAGRSGSLGLDDPLWG